MDDLHANPPSTTATAHLVGGPLDGVQDFPVTVHQHQIELTDGSSYRFSSFATLHYDRDTFIHSTLDPLLFAP